MSDRPIDLSPLPQPALADDTPQQRSPAPQAALHDAWLVPRSWALVVAILAAAGLLGSAALWQKLSSIQEEFARRTAASGAQAIEARTLAQAAQDNSRDQTVRLALLETRLGEVSLQRTQL